jgi:hypothetical protein
MKTPLRVLISLEETPQEATYKIIFAGSGPESNLFLIRLLASKGIVRSGQDWILPSNEVTPLIDLQAGKIALPNLNVERYGRQDINNLGLSAESVKAFVKGADVSFRVDKETGGTSVIVSSLPS